MFLLITRFCYFFHPNINEPQKNEIFWFISCIVKMSLRFCSVTLTVAFLVHMLDFRLWVFIISRIWVSTETEDGGAAADQCGGTRCCCVKKWTVGGGMQLLLAPQTERRVSALLRFTASTESPSVTANVQSLCVYGTEELQRDEIYWGAAARWAVTGIRISLRSIF